MARGKAIITCLVVITLETSTFSTPPLATAAPSSANCQAINFAGSSLRGALQDMNREYISSAFSRPQDPSENKGKIDEIKGGAIILVITNQNQLAKFLAEVEGTDLLVRKFVTYRSEGGTAARGENLRLSQGGRLDLDRGTDNPPAAEADLQWKREGATWRLEPANGARFKVLVAVPVIVHYMNSKDQRGSQNVQDELLPKTVQELFAPTGMEGEINTIWAQAGVLFFLYRFEDCKYSLKDFNPQKQSGAPKNIPSPVDDCQCLFRRINGVYNFPEVHGLDLYVWSNLKKVLGYGAPLRKDGPSPGPGAIWVDSVCMAYRCGHLLAHEAGHFLLGCHICVTRKVTPPKERGRCGFCHNIPDCSTGQGDLLMRDDAPGRTESQRLTPNEIQDARKEAFAHRFLVTGAGPQ